MKGKLQKALICLLVCSAAFGFPDADGAVIRTERKTISFRTRKKPGVKELMEKDRIIDSLLNVIEDCRSKIDSEREKVRTLSAGENRRQGKTGAGIFPEEYTADTCDSLLSIWYVQKRLEACREGEGYDMETVSFTSSVPDSVYKARLERMNSFITLPFNETVRNDIILYSEKMPTKMGHMLGLAAYYMPIFEEIFDRYGLPEELKYMAVIESALNPVALSRAGAAGIWQFMHQTGKSYGLHIDSFVDERYDVEKSADAAARYLRDAYDIFGDWALAISSYNCGAGNVNKAIRRSGSREFWDLYPYLPRETRGYVPAFVGAMYAFHYHRECGLTPDPVSMPAHADTIHVNRMLHFSQISELVGISLETLRNLNPQYKHDIVPGAQRTCVLKIPHDYTSAFIAMEDSVYVHREKDYFSPAVLDNIKNGGSADSEKIVYKVKKGDYLGKIASRHHVTVNQIKKWNNLRSNNLSIGQRLVIYRKGSSASTSTASSASATSSAKPAQKASAPEKTAAGTPAADSTGSGGMSAAAAVRATDGGAVKGNSAAEQDVKKDVQEKDVTYVVKKGDSLYSIAAGYPGVSAKDLMEYNGIGQNIRPGMKIRIPVRNR